MTTAVALLFIWAGFILSISFFESWVKFRAEGVPIPAALSIGRLIFTVLNRIEWIFSACLLVLFLFVKPIGSLVVAGFVVVLLMLTVQTFSLLPALDKRAKKRISEETLPASNLHLYFVAGEFVKLTALIICGINLLKPF